MWRIGGGEAVPHGELVIPVLNQECSSGRLLIMVPYFPRLFRHTGLTVGTPSQSPKPYLMPLNQRGAFVQTTEILSFYYPKLNDDQVGCVDWIHAVSLISSC